MKSLFSATCLLLSNYCFASSDGLEASINWLQSWAPKNIEFKVEKSSIKFSGCKQKDYLAVFNQPVSEHFILEMGAGYAKGQHYWGVFNQKISVKELFFTPRYQINHNLSFGFGLVVQSQTEFKNSQGVQFNLPRNTEWLVKTRTNGFAREHYWEWTASSQKWDTSDQFGSLFEDGATDNKVGLSYNGHF